MVPGRLQEHSAFPRCFPPASWHGLTHRLRFSIHRTPGVECRFVLTGWLPPESVASSAGDGSQSGAWVRQFQGRVYLQGQVYFFAVCTDSAFVISRNS